MVALPKNLFRGAKNLTKVSMPDSLRSIGSYAFSECVSLKEIDLPEKITKIDSYAFSGCTGLSEVKLPWNLTSLEYGAFHNCSSLEAVWIPKKTAKIDSSTFYDSSLLKTVYGIKGSAAETFAAEKSYTFIETQPWGTDYNDDSDNGNGSGNGSGDSSSIVPEGTIIPEAGAVLTPSVNNVVAAKAKYYLKPSFTIKKIAYSAKGIVKVNKKGVLQAKKSGTVTVTLTSADGQTATYTFTAEVPKMKKKEVASTVSINASSMITGINLIKPSKYESSKPSVASIDATTGEITPLSAGSTKIIAYIAGKKYKATLKVKIPKVK